MFWMKESFSITNYQLVVLTTRGNEADLISNRFEFDSDLNVMSTGAWDRQERKR